MSLKYSKDAVIKGFSGSDQFVQTSMFADDIVKTPLQRVDEINTMANDCRDWYEPIYADERKYLPVSTSPSSTSASVIVVANTKPPMRVKENELMNVLLIGAGVFVLYKLLS